MLPAEETRSSATWKMMTMTTSPARIGRAPLSPPRMRSHQRLQILAEGVDQELRRAPPGRRRSAGAGIREP